MTTPFNIRVIKPIVFTDCKGTITKEYPIGTILVATAIGSNYYVHSYGGIFFDEAEKVI